LTWGKKDLDLDQGDDVVPAMTVWGEFIFQKPVHYKEYQDIFQAILSLNPGALQHRMNNNIIRS